jgi:imidazolonepropionase
MLSLGVTTVECKSGYGLDLATEVKQLEVANTLNENHCVDLVSTFLGAHAIPTEHKDNPDKYIEEVFSMLENEKVRELSEFVDIFCEDAVFNVEQSRKILQRAKDLGYKLKIHADEIVSLGGAELAAELDCVSSDHLMAASDKGINDLANKGVVANILPGTTFNLNKDYADARKMIESGCIVALSSDYNPGSCPTENLQLIMTLGSTKLKMTPDEVISSVTINAAKALDRDKTVGSIEVGKNADFVIFDAQNLPYIMYHFGINHVKDVYKNGKIVVENQKILED